MIGIQGLVLGLLSRFSPGYCVAACFGTAASADYGLLLGDVLHAAYGAPIRHLLGPDATTSTSHTRNNG